MKRRKRKTVWAPSGRRREREPCFTELGSLAGNTVSEYRGQMPLGKRETYGEDIKRSAEARSDVLAEVSDDDTKSRTWRVNNK